MDQLYQLNLTQFASQTTSIKHVDSTTRLPTYANAPSRARIARHEHDYDALYNELAIAALLKKTTYMIEPEHAEEAKAAKSHKTSPKRSKKSSEKIKKSVLGQMMNEYPFNLFNFKTRDECKSSSRSKGYYISKKDLVDIIEKDPELSKAFPKGFKKQPKEAICDTLFGV